MSGSAILAFYLFVSPALRPAFVQAAPQSAVHPAESGTVAGVVRDASGAGVPGATVIARTASGAERQAVTGPDGRFSVPISATGEVTLVVRAGGFADAKQTLAAGAARQNVEISLVPATVSETVTVTAARSEQRTTDAPASINVLDGDRIRQTPAMVADDVLRQIPTFSLFRRSSSISSHPTTQGVSLRGIGPSGVSRTLVLLDGVPFNDPFGGWVYWTRVPLENASRIEVVDGSGSSLYGNYAMGGVINIMTSPPSRRTVDLRTQYGNMSSPKLDFTASDLWGPVGVVVDGSAFKTDGFENVVAGERGAIDNKASVDFRNFNAKVDYSPTERVRAFFRTGYFHEERNNAKVSTFDPRVEESNDTTWKTASGGVQIRLPDQSDLQASVFGDVETFHSNFLAVPASNPARSVARVTTLQTVPTNGVGGRVRGGGGVTGHQLFTAGTDWRWVDGESQEDLMDTARGLTVVSKRVSGGSQRSLGAFVQEIIAPTTKLELTFNLRADHWRNYDPHIIDTVVATGVSTPRALSPRADDVVSPRVAALYRVTERVSVWGDLGTGFRAPTLNELYRQFSVGAVVTRANDQLGPERLKGGEAGVRVSPARNVTVRSTWFDNRVKNPVSNVTIGTNLQQRQNLGRTKVAGWQNDAEYRLGTAWIVAAGYVYERAKVVEFTANPDLASNCPGFVAAGKPGEACDLPQVPRQRGSLLVAYSKRKYFDASFSVQVVGHQFEEDQNARFVPAAALTAAGYGAADSSVSNPGLPKYTIVSINASRAIGRILEVFFGAQNVANRQYFAFTQPTTTGSPRQIQGGVRVRFAGK